MSFFEYAVTAAIALNTVSLWLLSRRIGGVEHGFDVGFDAGWTACEFCDEAERDVDLAVVS